MSSTSPLMKSRLFVDCETYPRWDFEHQEVRFDSPWENPLVWGCQYSRYPLETDHNNLDSCQTLGHSNPLHEPVAYMHKSCSQIALTSENWHNNIFLEQNWGQPWDEVSYSPCLRCQDMIVSTLGTHTDVNQWLVHKLQVQFNNPLYNKTAYLEELGKELYRISNASELWFIVSVQ